MIFWNLFQHLYICIWLEPHCIICIQTCNYEPNNSQWPLESGRTLRITILLKSQFEIIFSLSKNDCKAKSAIPGNFRFFMMPRWFCKCELLSAYCLLSDTQNKFLYDKWHKFWMKSDAKIIRTIFIVYLHVSVRFFLWLKYKAPSSIFIFIVYRIAIVQCGIVSFPHICCFIF